MKPKFEAAIHLVNAIVISIILVAYLNRSYPKVGHDYGYFIPNLIDTYLHYRVNGLSIQWYTPSFGGGLPSYANPQQIQFSLPQVLTFLTSPWTASVISTVCFALIGYFAMYYFLSHALSLSRPAGILGGLFFTLNGFYIEHMAAGHLGCQVFPLLAVFGVALFAAPLSEIVSATIIALLLALMVNEAGFYMITIFLLALMITIPGLYLWHPNKFHFKRLLRIAVFSLLLSILLSGSKIYAVYSFMRFFPRTMADHFSVSPLSGLLGIFMQLLGTMSLAPILKLIGSHPSQLAADMIAVTGAQQYGYWELDVSLTPVVFGLLLIGAYHFFQKPIHYVKLFLSGERWIGWILLVFATWLTIEFTLAKGLIYPFLQNLPIINSLHVNPRFSAAFLFPLAICAAIVYDRWSAKWPSAKSIRIFLLTASAALLPLYLYFLFQGDLQNRSYDVSESETIYTAIRSGEDFSVTSINDDTATVDLFERNAQALRLHQSDLEPYEPIFGYDLRNFHPEIRAGSIWEVSEGYYNMTNPSGYVFPEINGTRPFERIKVGDEKNLAAFAAHRQPDWKIPLIQRILNWVSGLSFVVMAAILVYVATKQRIAWSSPCR
jgi:hypothetical protein